MPATTKAQSGLTDTWGRRNRKLEDRQCPQCGSAFRPLRASSAYCSRPCARKKNGGHNRKAESWWISSKGYVIGRVWAEGKRVNTRLHRLMMERHLGRPLAADEDVHHRDGDKQNNDLSNLEVLTHAEHCRAHNVERTYRKGYRLNLTDEQRRARSDRMKAMRAAKATGGEA